MDQEFTKKEVSDEEVKVIHYIIQSLTETLELINADDSLKELALMTLGAAFAKIRGLPLEYFKANAESAFKSVEVALKELTQIKEN